MSLIRLRQRSDSRIHNRKSCAVPLNTPEGQTPCTKVQVCCSRLALLRFQALLTLSLPRPHARIDRLSARTYSNGIPFDWVLEVS
jgi:hypothetical protein